MGEAVKRLIDVVGSVVGLVLSSPLLVPVMLAIYWQDKHSPFYVADRTGKGESPFKLFKLRSMIINADKSGVDSTSASDNRITPVGAFVRKTKLDEMPQLWNVLKGEMSLVGPRPNVERETSMYTPEEKKLLSVRPGITDLASIVFADEGDILDGADDPDLDYNQRIRPWKSRLALFCIEHQSVTLDIQIIYLTVLTAFNRAKALEKVVRILESRKADPRLCEIASRKSELVPFPPPGAAEIVTARI